jgi:hypothetical protein
VVNALQAVYAPEEDAREKQLRAPERLTSHQPSRGPRLTTLKTWREQHPTAH